MNKIVASIFLSLTLVANIHSSDEIVSPFAGTWYPSNKQFLLLQIDKYLSNVKSQNLDKVIALILPHAGYAFSAQTAAYGVKEIIGKKYSRIIIIGTSHYAQLPNQFTVSDVKYYTTPLGKVEVDTDFAAKLKKLPEYCELGYNIHYREHSIQLIIPLLQSSLTNFKIVPIILGSLNDITLKKLAGELSPMLNNETLIIISSDFTHYGVNYDYLPFPADENTESKLKDMDMEAVKSILNLNYIEFNNFVDKTDDTICGKYCIDLLLLMLPKDSKSYLLNYSTSGKTTENFSNSVSYFSLAFTGEWKNNIPDKVTTEKNSNTVKELTEKDKTELLTAAKKSVEYFLNNGKIPSSENLGLKISDPMKEERGVFVTITENGELRGCIGNIYAVFPLYEAVIKLAISSAFNDHRFYPVTESELPFLDYEISVLTIPEKINSYKNIILGKDGIILEKDGHTAVFLPQVATEQGWNLEETLTHLSRKATLPSDAWKEATFMVFQAEKFKMRSYAPLKPDVKK